MIPITELADTLSFGLVGKIRKKTHVLEDDVQLMIHENKRSQDNLRLKAACKKNIPAATAISIPDGIRFLPENENTITAAYSFDDSVIARSLPKPLDDSSTASSSFDGRLTRSVSLQHPPIFHRITSDDGAQRRQSMPRCPIASSLDRNMHATKKKASDTISALANGGSQKMTKTSVPKKVSISDSVTDLVSGASRSIETESSRTLVSTKIPEPSAKSKVLRSNINGNYRKTAYSSCQDIDENDASSVSSLNGTEFRLVIDDHIIPGMPDASQLQRLSGPERPYEMFMAK